MTTSPSPFKIIAIAAMDQGRVIGFDNKLPWRIPEDSKRFAKLTRGHSVLMGRKTYQSLPDEYRPLSDRENIVLTRNPQALAGEQGIVCVSSIDSYLTQLKSGERKVRGNILWIIGGQQVYQDTLDYWDGVELTLVKGQHQGDTFFPEFEESFNLLSSKDFNNFSFLTYERQNPQNI